MIMRLAQNHERSIIVDMGELYALIIVALLFFSLGVYFGRTTSESNSTFQERPSQAEPHVSYGRFGHF